MAKLHAEVMHIRYWNKNRLNEVLSNSTVCSFGLTIHPIESYFEAWFTLPSWGHRQQLSDWELWSVLPCLFPEVCQYIMVLVPCFNPTLISNGKWIFDLLRHWSYRNVNYDDASFVLKQRRCLNHLEWSLSQSIKVAIPYIHQNTSQLILKYKMLRLLFVVSLTVLFVGVSADTCSSVEALGYINVTRPLSLGYINEQSKYVSRNIIFIS